MSGRDEHQRARIQAVQAPVDPGLPEDEDPFADVELIEDVNLADEAAGQSEPSEDADDGKDDASSADAQESGDQALVLDGHSGYAVTTGPVIDETTSFTVSAAVRLDSKALVDKPVGYRAQLLGQRAGTTSAESSWSLWWELTSVVGGIPQGRWHFSRTPADVAAPTGASGQDEELAPDSFQTVPMRADLPVEVSGAYDALTGEINVYVNADADQVGGFDELRAGAGELSVGRARRAGAWTDFLPAQIARVRVWSGAMQDSQISTQVLG